MSLKFKKTTPSVGGQGNQEEVTQDLSKGDNEEEIDIDLNDPDVEKAAVKIQASFKGFQARKAKVWTARKML